MDRLALCNRISASENTLKFVARFDDFPHEEVTHVWNDTMELIAKSYVVQTARKIIERCVLMSSDPGDLVLDPTCGSGTTAYVAEQWGRSAEFKCCITHQRPGRTNLSSPSTQEPNDVS
jgi:adenine-specific DNA-methyltransferase